ncbi:anhydro-N-acetylmuramic acid kinase [Utexia brackfieldae]|uniref:anhydro-N-acetylmuramic acid kinase n=1 Tax=Utexia brackfieldae TaxID=3074108 RepID=UPI00370D8A6E
MPQSSHLYIGIMSGTSLDGVDVTLMSYQQNNINILASQTYAIDPDLKTALLQICASKQVSLQQLGEIDHRLGQLYADCVLSLLSQTTYQADQISAIGCHGQTIYHHPHGHYPFTMQIGDANIIAVKTGITTIADFRRKDMALGGQGAPLVPAFHQAIFSEKTHNRVILNLGGIANISILFPGQSVTGYDTGPANVLLDGWIELHCQQPYDRNGNWAKQGQCQNRLLEQLLTDPYFALSPPKSTGRERFNLAWLTPQITGLTIAAVDIQATLIELTVQSIVNELQKLSPTPNLPCELIVCGGGARNVLMMSLLTQYLPDWSVTTTDQYGIDVDYVEAMAFAWLAHQRLFNLAGNIPAVTGAKSAISLGVIYPALTHKETDHA